MYTLSKALERKNRKMYTRPQMLLEIKQDWPPTMSIQSPAPNLKEKTEKCTLGQDLPNLKENHNQIK